MVAACPYMSSACTRQGGADQPRVQASQHIQPPVVRRHCLCRSELAPVCVHACVRACVRVCVCVCVCARARARTHMPCRAAGQHFTQ